jgi:alginate O-acetyltransferase complex protein AlgI
VHGLALAIERPFLHSGFYRAQNTALRILRMAIVFLFVSFAWLLFRLPDFHQVALYVTSVAKNWRIWPSAEAILPIVIYSLPVVAYHAGQFGFSAALRPAVRNGLLSIMLAMIVLNSGTSGAFIYFQF